jgi:hypothetical protein
MRKAQGQGELDMQGSVSVEATEAQLAGSMGNISRWSSFGRNAHDSALNLLNCTRICALCQRSVRVHVVPGIR